MEVVVGSLDSIPTNSMAEFSIDGKCVLVCRAGDAIFATSGICPHRGAQLSQGTLNGTSVVCPWHEWEFDVETGFGLTNPVSALTSYVVRIKDGMIVVQVPDI